MDDERLKNLGGGGYWKELLQRIRDIRASEKVFYRQVLDIYATSIDYDPKADVSIEFFKKVQNKIHYAVHGHTAAEVIFTRADAEKEFMGLMTFHGNRPYLKDVDIAKNYLDEKELRALGQIISGYLGPAEKVGVFNFEDGYRCRKLFKKPAIVNEMSKVRLLPKENN